MKYLTMISLVVSIALFISSCASQCNKMSKTNAKLIAGNHDFGKGKEAKKYKKMNRR